MRYNTKDMSSECKCGLSTFGVRGQINKTMGAAYKTEVKLEKQLVELRKSVENMGNDCKINVDEPIKYIDEFHGFMDSIGYREKPEEGLNYWEIDIQDFFIMFNDSVQKVLTECNTIKTPFKLYK